MSQTNNVRAQAATISKIAQDRCAKFQSLHDNRLMRELEKKEENAHEENER